MKMKKIGLIETKIFHFHMMFKNGGQGGGSSDPPEPPSGSATGMHTGHRVIIKLFHSRLKC